MIVRGSLSKMVIGAITGILICMAIVMFATKKHVHGGLLLVSALVGAVVCWKWDTITSSFSSSYGQRQGMLTRATRGTFYDSSDNYDDEHSY